MKISEVKFPTRAHEAAFWDAVGVLKKNPKILAIGLTGSIARNQGSSDADVDINVFTDDKKVSEAFSKEMDALASRITNRYRSGETGRYFQVSPMIRSLEPKPKPRSWTNGPDDFEIEIGMSFAYAISVFERSGVYARARKKFMPYYSERLRRARLAEVRKYCLNNLNHINPYLQRELYFQAFKRLIDASREFLQAAFIARKKYPIAYDKWIKYETKEILGLPNLYRELVSVYQIKKLESRELSRKGERIKKLLQIYT